MTSSLIRPLFDGPLDIVGDVHGEIDALRSLLVNLGYEEGRHPEGRRLVFLGDLTDRGPDSPAVVDLVSAFVEEGWAQCVLGNHDLNILLKHRKHDNRWFYGEGFRHDGSVIPQKLADDAIRQQILDFFATLPLALERDDVRVVHACWKDEMIELARRADDAVSLYKHYRALIDIAGLDAIDRGLALQNCNPVKVLTSGLEERSAEPIEAGGKVRHERRVPWWDDYEDVFCVFGHYAEPDRSPLVTGRSFCVDFGVGKRWTERLAGQRNGCKLAALRFPEKVVVFDEDCP
jgi:diadenosine tetraphosphatase ApaH/serine/threonine PP2A family protein phosphatase